LNASDVPDHEPTTDIALPEKASAPAGDTAADFPQAGPEDATDRVPLPIAAAAPWPKTSEFTAPVAPAAIWAIPDVPSAEEVTHQSPLPPFQPPGGFVPTGPPSPARPRGNGRRGVTLLAFAAAIAVVAAGAVAALLWPGGGGKRPVAAVTASAPAAPGASSTVQPSPGGIPAPQVSAPGGGTGSSAPPQAATASPGPGNSTAPGQSGGVPAGGAPAGGVPPNGLGMPYRTVQQDQGYFEGVVTVTNRTSVPLSAWELSFSYPGAQVRMVWGGVLVQAGSLVIIRNDPLTGSIPPGGTFVVKFGAGGVPSLPRGCRFGGRECGFTP
jgi:hypothetical protein